MVNSKFAAQNCYHNYLMLEKAPTMGQANNKSPV